MKKVFIDSAVEQFAKDNPNAIFYVTGQTSGSSGFGSGAMTVDAISNMANGGMPIVGSRYAVVTNMFYDKADKDAYEKKSYWEWVSWRNKKYNKARKK